MAFFPPEQVLPQDWTEVRIVTDKVDPDLAEDLLAQLAQARLTVDDTPDGVVVRRTSTTDALSCASFADGVFPDLRTRGFQVTVSTLSL